MCAGWTTGRASLLRRLGGPLGVPDQLRDPPGAVALTAQHHDVGVVQQPRLAGGAGHHAAAIAAAHEAQARADAGLLDPWLDRGIEVREQRLVPGPDRVAAPD